MDLDAKKHTRYWQRCLRSLLPHQYTANDSTRMLLGCFTVAALDLLGSSDLLTDDDRRRYREWVLSCQHPGGGFSGGSTHAFPRGVYSSFDFVAGEPEVGARGEANIAATLFALQLLALLGSGKTQPETETSESECVFGGVDRNATLRWLRQLQRPDGSFGEFLVDVADPASPSCRKRVIAGGADMRYCYIASMIRWMLRGDDALFARDSPAWVDDINVDALVAHMRRGQTYDGGFAESSSHESHAGYAFCAIAAMELLDRPAEGGPAQSSALARGIADLPGLMRWLASRSFVYQTGNDDDNTDSDSDEEWHESVVSEITTSDSLTPSCVVGFNGRCNKHADSCYTWWTLGSIAILQRNDLALDYKEDTSANWDASRRFLLTQTQHVIGGFAKTPGGAPDIYHSYLGLASLATHGDAALKSFDPSMSVSLDTVRAIEAGRRGLLRGLTDKGASRREAFLDMAHALNK
ncbi:type-1 protein geranylgeranyltransferase subunit beta [Ophiostoma piceae UAMH 11346]|uniref:Type-1 protein geranylgeranyltransferase subunit beta n=1 Tax=Ophiostoma piceae (strain UAMH 11346) TaxID=1262450 RepID=S3BUL7_OPHP1|nr:type-1 protein geranylgeranyltransferase subunit beta [Ophiostoma piceae UAMH 11346]